MNDRAYTKRTIRQELYVLKNYRDMSNREVAQKIGISPSQVRALYRKHGLRKTMAKGFKKGHIPLNKGKKMRPQTYERCKNYFWKEGHTPANQRPIGSLREAKREGYYEIKVADPNSWISLQRHTWEQIHGPVQKGHIVVFKDGVHKNKTKIGIDEIECITRAEHLRRNRSKNKK